MTARFHYTISCDRPGCFAVFSSGKTTAYETRRDANVVGWSHTFKPRERGGPARSIDACPTHAPAVVST